MLSVLLYLFSVFVFCKNTEKNVCTATEQAFFSIFRQDLKVFRQDLNFSAKNETFSDKIETCFFFNYDLRSRREQKQKPKTKTLNANHNF